MRKKESAPEPEPQVFVFEGGEQQIRSNATPAELVREQKRPSLKTLTTEKEGFRKNSFNVHMLKQNFFKKDSNKENIDHFDSIKIQTPAELKELNDLCESIFIASDMGYDIDFGTPPKPEGKKASLRDIQTPYLQQKKEPPEKLMPQTLAEVGDINDLQGIHTFEQTNAPFSCQYDEKTQISLDQSDTQQPKVSGLEINRNGKITTITIKNKISFLIHPLPPGIIINCKVRRSRDIMNFLTPEYDFFLDCGLRHVVSAKKKSLSSKQAFQISTEIGVYRKETIVASLNANVLRNQFLLTGKEQGRDIKFKYIYGAIDYGKLNKNKSQRTMKVTLPAETCISVRSDHVRNFSFDSVDTMQKMILTRKQFDEEQSEKNFVLVDDDEDDYIYLRLTKDTQNVFNLAIQHPLSPLQAIGIVLTRFDAQLK